MTKKLELSSESSYSASYDSSYTKAYDLSIYDFLYSLLTIQAHCTGLSPGDSSTRRFREVACVTE